MSQFEFSGSIDLQELAQAMEDEGNFVGEAWVQDEIRSELGDVDDAIEAFLRNSGVDADQINDLDSEIERQVSDYLENDNLDATLKEDLIELQERVTRLEAVLHATVEAAVFGTTTNKVVD